MKGLYPAVVYVLLFAIGIIVFISIYHFTNDFVYENNAELEKVQAEKICVFLKNLDGKEGEFEVDIRDFKIETNPLKIIGSSVYSCGIGLNDSGSCLGECRISVLGDKVVFS